jgi:hypothetical protein
MATAGCAFVILMTSANATQTSRTRLRIGAISLIVVIFLVGQNLLSTASNIQGYLARDSWVATNATVIHHNSKTHWLVYEYTVNEQSYTSTQLSFTEDSKSELGIPDISRDFPEGKIFTIYYDPNNPSHAVIYLEADLNWGLGLGILILLIGIYVGGRIVSRRYLQWVQNKVNPT